MGRVNNVLEEEYDNTGLVYRALDVSQPIKEYYRGNRFKQRFYTGFDVHASEIARWFVLTESDEAIARGLDLIQKFNELVRYLRRHYGGFEYCCVRHRQGDKKRINLHAVYFGKYIPQQVIEDWWWKNYASHRSKMGRVYNVKRQAWYLCKYLNSEDFERYHFSIGWVFPGWIGFSQWIKEEFGQYPTKEMLLELARMGKGERKEATWYGMFSDIRKYGWKEVLKRQNGKWKVGQGRHALKKKLIHKRFSTGDDSGQQLELWCEEINFNRYIN